jgi:V/A-type H+/Na+-transporting ATPase subunit K
MVTLSNSRPFVLLAVLLLAGGMLCQAAVAAEPDDENPEAVEEVHDMAWAVRAVGLGLAAAIVLSLAGMATAKVQAAVGAGGTGAIAEKPELFINIFVLYAIPETILVLGFVIAYLLISRI